MFSIFVNTLSATVPLSISPTTTVAEIKQMLSKLERMPLRHFDVWFQDQQLSDVALTADACGITRDSFVTISEKPLNHVIISISPLNSFQRKASYFPNLYPHLSFPLCFQKIAELSNHDPSLPFVHLNVGGSLFTPLRATLTASSYFEDLLAEVERGRVKLPTDPRCFICV